MGIVGIEHLNRPDDRQIVSYPEVPEAIPADT